MKEFFIGLLVILVLMLLSAAGFMLFPLIIVLGIFLRYLISVALFIFAVWLIGKVTLWGIEQMKKKS